MHIKGSTVTMTSCEISGNTATVNMIHKTNLYFSLFYLIFTIFSLLTFRTSPLISHRHLSKPIVNLSVCKYLPFSISSLTFSNIFFSSNQSIHDEIIANIFFWCSSSSRKTNMCFYIEWKSSRFQNTECKSIHFLNLIVDFFLISLLLGWWD